MSVLVFWALNMSVALLSMEGQKADFIKNILICVPKMNEGFRVWNDMRVSNYWQNFHFWVNFKGLLLSKRYFPTFIFISVKVISLHSCIWVERFSAVCLCTTSKCEILNYSTLFRICTDRRTPILFCLQACVTLSVKPQLNYFFCDLLFSTKNHPIYGKYHSVKV